MASSPRLDVRLPAPAVQWLDAVAAERGRTRSEVLRAIVVEAVPTDAWPDGTPTDVDPRGRKGRT